MNSHTPTTAANTPMLKLVNGTSDRECDLDMLEIEEAMKHLDAQADAEAFWLGRLLADRKSARIAA
jgi:hypothetical protein